MFGGDEVSSVVCDMGSSTTRVGYAGEDSPKAIIPTAVGTVSSGDGDFIVGNQALNFARAGVEVSSPVENGVVKDWAAVEKVYDHAFRQVLRLNPAEHPIMSSESMSADRQQREKLAELFFEKFDSPAVFLSKSPVLAAFASGRATALVLDSGKSMTSAVPVHDGFALSKSSVMTGLGGDYMTEQFQSMLNDSKPPVQVRPHYAFKRSEDPSRPGEYSVSDVNVPGVTLSHHAMLKKVIVDDLKETIGRVSESAFDGTVGNIPSVPYELPDGQTVNVAAERFSIPELLFNPPAGMTDAGESQEGMGLHKMVAEAISKTDADVRRELYGNVVLTGGNTLFPLLKERLEKELMDVAPQLLRVKLVASAQSSERRYSAWTGGSILASLGSFQQMWISKEEWKEHGASLVDKKCP